MSFNHMESDDKGDQDGACLKKYVITKNVEINMPFDMLLHSEMPSKSTGQDKKYVAIDAGCGIEDISCISKDEDLNGHSGDNNQIILTGSSSSVNSFFPTEYKEQIDVQSSKHYRGNSENFEGNCLCKSSHPCAREALRSPVDPSETSSCRDEHAVAISPKADLSQRTAIDVIQNVQNYKRKSPGSIESDDHLFAAAAALVGSERDEVLEDASPIKEPPKYQMLENNEGADELVDVPVCDICGDVGRERLLALCSNCSDGAEHTYCMSIKRDELPGDDWMCEECTGAGYSHKILVDNEGVNAVKAPPSEMGHGSADICVDSSKVTLKTRIDHTSAPSGLGKRGVGPDMLANSSNKKRVLSGSLGFYAQRVVVSPRSRRIGLGATRVASSSAVDSSRNVFKRMHSPVAGSLSKGRLIKSSGLKDDPQDDGGCRKESSAGESVAAQMRKKYIPKKLRKSESFQISRPFYPDPYDSKKVLSDDLKYQNKVDKCKIAQRSHSFDFQNSRPVSPISPGRLSRAETHQPASVKTEVEQSLMRRKRNLDPQSTRVHRTSEQALVPPTAEKAPPIIIRNKNVSGSKEKILNTGPAKRRSTNAVKDSNCCSGMKRGQMTDDMEVEEGAVDEANVQMDGATKALPDSFSSGCTIDPAASSLNCAWRGIFRIEGGSELPIWCNKLQAHLSSSASPTVFGTVSNWPGEIMVKEVLKRDICVDQFQNCGTMGTVYFFAEGLESDRLMYKKFLNCMARNNLALQSNLGGAELLVFPSLYLPKKVRRKDQCPYSMFTEYHVLVQELYAPFFSGLNKRFYMCGIFKANYSSYLDNYISLSSPQKGSQKPEPGRQLPFHGLSGHGNGSPSAIPISIQGHVSTGMKETVPNCWVKSTIPDEVDATSTDGRSRSGDMLDCSGHKQKERHRTHVSSRVGNAVHPACSNNLGFSSIEECPIKAGFRYPLERSSSPLDTLLYAVDVIENFKTNPGSLSAGSDHCGKVNKLAGLEVQPLEDTTSAYHRVNLELSMSSKNENPDNCHELDLLSGLASSKDGQIELGGGGNYDGGRSRCYNVSLDLSLALP